MGGSSEVAGGTALLALDLITKDITVCRGATTWHGVCFVLRASASRLSVYQVIL